MNHYISQEQKTIGGQKLSKILHGIRFFIVNNFIMTRLKQSENFSDEGYQSLNEEPWAWSLGIASPGPRSYVPETCPSNSRPMGATEAKETIYMAGP